MLLGSTVKEIRETEVVVTDGEGRDQTLPNDAVFSMIGREAPSGLLPRSSGVRSRGEIRTGAGPRSPRFLLFCTWLYHWKGGKAFPFLGKLPDWLNPKPAEWWAALAATGWKPRRGAAGPRDAPRHTQDLGIGAFLLLHAGLLVAGPRLRPSSRIRQKRTPYVKVQTITLTAVQWLPLFLLPEIILPLAGPQRLRSMAAWRAGSRTRSSPS